MAAFPVNMMKLFITPGSWVRQFLSGATGGGSSAENCTLLDRLRILPPLLGLSSSVNDIISDIS